MWIETLYTHVKHNRQTEFIRQQWRMWIETAPADGTARMPANSFASNGECGLKQVVAHAGLLDAGNSFASNGECGLKHPNMTAV